VGGRCGWEDEEAVRRMRERLASKYAYEPPDQLQAVVEIIERAVATGVPFAGLGEETHAHWLAANALAEYDQEWLMIPACAYHSSAIRDGLWPDYGKYAGREARAFLRGLVEGVPLFGQRLPSDGLVYAAI